MIAEITARIRKKPMLRSICAVGTLGHTGEFYDDNGAAHSVLNNAGTFHVIDMPGYRSPLGASTMSARLPVWLPRRKRECIECVKNIPIQRSAHRCYPSRHPRLYRGHNRLRVQAAGIGFPLQLRSRLNRIDPFTAIEGSHAPSKLAIEFREPRRTRPIALFEKPEVLPHDFARRVVAARFHLGRRSGLEHDSGAEFDLARRRRRADYAESR